MIRLIAVLALLAVGCGVGVAQKGDPGEKGDPGTPGMTIKVILDCSAIWTTPSGDHVNAEHRILVYSDDSVMSTCELGTDSIAAVSSVNFWRAGQKGASSGYCNVWYGGGWASFEYSSNGSSVKNNGTDLVGTMDCTSH